MIPTISEYLAQIEAPRVITRHADREPEERWEGQLIAPDDPPRWKGPSVEAVIADMNRAYSEIPDSEYQIRE